MTIIYAILLIVAIGFICYVLIKEFIFLMRKAIYVINLMEIQNELLNEQNELIAKIFGLFGGNPAEIDAMRSKHIVTDSDRMIVEKLKKKIKSDELILKIRYNGRIEKWKKADWALIVKMGHRGRFDLLFMN